MLASDKTQFNVPETNMKRKINNNERKKINVRGNHKPQFLY